MALTRPRFGQLNTSVVAEADPITVLHQGATNANVDVGFLFNRANGLVANVALYWSESGNSIVAAFTSNSGTSDSNIAASGYANITIGSLLTVNGAAIAINGNTGTYGQVITSTGSGLIWADQLGIVSTIRASGNINAVGNVIAGNVTANTNVFAGNVLATGFFYANGTPFVSSSYGNVQMLANLASTAPTTIGNIYTTNGIYWANGAAYSTSTINPAVYFGKVTATTAPTLIDTLPVTGNNLVRWTTTSYDSVYNQYRSSTIDSVNNGTTVNYNEYSFIVSNVGTTVATFTSNITSGNINLWATGNTASVAVTFERVVLGSGTTSGYLTAGPAGPAGATGATGTIANTASWIVTTNSTASTSTTTGALQVAGGAGIAGNLWTGGNISASNITATTYFVGNGSQLTGITMPWNIVSSNITMSKNNGYFVDTTTGPKMLTLPASNTLGDTIRINDLAGTFASNNLTVGANGGKIQGVAQDLLVSVNQKSFGLVYSNSTYGWKLLEL